MLDVPALAGILRKGAAVRPVLKFLKAAGPYPADILGDAPKGLVGLIAGEVSKPLRVRRLAALWVKMQTLLKTQSIEKPQPPSPKLALPALAAAANETDEELQDLWARLLVAAMNQERARRVRLRFVDALEQMDPVDAVLLKWIYESSGGRVDAAARTGAMQALNLSSDEVETSFANFAIIGFSENQVLTPFGREFIRVVVKD